MPIIRTGSRIVAAALCALSLVGAAPNWNTYVVETGDGGHRLGNPDAQVKLVEFISYTCKHCADFEREADGPLRIGYVANGGLSVEVRPLIRNAVDVTAAMLVACGPKDRFFLNHAAFLRSQETWGARLDEASAATRNRWQSGNGPDRRRAIATYLKFYEIMGTRGYDRQQVDKCLADEKEAHRLAVQSEADSEKYGIESTPGFLIDGIRLAGTYNWQDLAPQIAARF